MTEPVHKGVSVSLQGLAKNFGQVEALKPLDLDISSGELVAFLGPSGCGKTTTLLLIAGIYKASAGGIRFDGEPVDSLHPSKRDIGMVFQSYALYPHLSLFENIAFPLRLRRIPRDELKARVTQAADQLQIGEVMHRRPGQVSGGQQQRAALARALVKEPRMLLLDEPLSNLDAQVRLQARSEIRRLQQELGITSILVTHDQSEALAMADRIAVFRAGELLQFAPPEELYRSPADAFVAQFVGNPPMNLFHGEVNGGVFRADGIQTAVPGSWPDGPGSLGIRPEDVTIVTAAHEATVSTMLQVMEPLGRDYLLNCAMDKSFVQALTADRIDASVGDVIHLRFAPDKLQLFAADGRRQEP